MKRPMSKYGPGGKAHKGIAYPSPCHEVLLAEKARDFGLPIGAWSSRVRVAVLKRLELRTEKTQLIRRTTYTPVPEADSKRSVRRLMVRLAQRKLRKERKRAAFIAERSAHYLRKIYERRNQRKIDQGFTPPSINDISRDAMK